MAFEIRSLLCIVSVVMMVAFPPTESSMDRGPRMRIFTRQAKADTLMLPSNATSIRENITDSFSCEDRSYGYYADVENECQIFHVCLPVTFSDGRNKTYKWSFICPEETVFNQEVFVCVREEDLSINCEDSEEYYALNDNFGGREEEDVPEGSDGGEEDQPQGEDEPQDENQELKQKLQDDGSKQRLEDDASKQNLEDDETRQRLEDYEPKQNSEYRESKENTENYEATQATEAPKVTINDSNELQQNGESGESISTTSKNIEIPNNRKKRRPVKRGQQRIHRGV